MKYIIVTKLDGTEIYVNINFIISFSSISNQTFIVIKDYNRKIEILESTEQLINKIKNA